MSYVRVESCNFGPGSSATGKASHVPNWSPPVNNRKNTGREEENGCLRGWRGVPCGYGCGAPCMIGVILLLELFILKTQGDETNGFFPLGIPFFHCAPAMRRRPSMARPKPPVKNR